MVCHIKLGPLTSTALLPAIITIKDANGTILGTAAHNSPNPTATSNVGNTPACAPYLTAHNSFEFTPTTSTITIEVQRDCVGFGRISIDNINLQVPTASKLAFFYDDRGQRVRKEVYSSGNTYLTYYVRDASGSPMGIYTGAFGPTIRQPTVLKEQPIYGSSRLGVHYRQTNSDVYQLTDHLGNVRAVIMKNGGNAVSLTAKTDYYPFGMPMPNRNIEGNYRYKFQGQEKDSETGKEAFELRLWDGRIGRWLTTDPAGQYASPYLGMGNNPINGTDPDGAFWKPIVNADGSVSYVAEENDTVQSFVDQYGVTYDQAKGLLNGNENNIQAGVTTVSGRNVYDMFGTDLLRLQLTGGRATQQRVIDHFNFALQHSASDGANAWLSSDYFGGIKYQLQTPIDYKGSIEINGKNVDISLAVQWYTSEGFLFNVKYHPAVFGNTLKHPDDDYGTMFGSDKRITHHNIRFGYLMNGRIVWQLAGAVQLTVHTKNKDAFQQQIFTKKPKYNYIGRSNGFKD
ncbi:Rhs family-like protein [Formosa sp. Hel1_33_131]|uniref:RHS repeat domain-containing protein n=1 Tax=Formosa sp. Hel1_33_131 TaxID=1336794 RepID=UPI00084E3214|nr:RHS repeat-associated core domain-containing protein [Formosa sp. Hel1_33_131]AOR27535.1 Rhs family-like protein [Formosa sp. Hel1_33_131]